MNDSDFHPFANPLGTAAPEGVVTPAPAAAETGERLRAVDGAAVGMVAAQPKSPVTDATTAMDHTQLTAARDAAAFVAQIFAEVSAPEPTTTAQVLAGGDAAAQQDAASDVPGQPDGRPGEGIAPLHGQNILILGLGASGLAMARWCVRCGARQVTVADTRAAPPQLPALEQELPQVRFVSGALDAALVQGQELHAVYRSPGLSPAVIAPVVLAARADGASVGGELSLFSAGLAVLRAAHGYAPMVLAITGTNGKTTVTSLTGQLVERSGKRVAVAGNIGPTLLDTLASHIDAGSLPDVWVLELSSFQLDDVTGFEPTAATVLNITQDHLDWHGDMAAYASAKAHIFGETGLMILNRDDPEVMRMLPPPGRPKAAAAPSGGSAAHEVASVGAQNIPPPGRPKAAAAPSGGSAEHEVASVGAQNMPPPGRPKAAAAPPGGSAAHEVASVGAQNIPPPGRPKAAAAPPGGSAAHEVASVGGNTSSAPAKGRLTKPQVREHVTFGADMPRRPGDFGIEVVSGMPWLVRALAADETRKRGRPTQDEDLHIQRLMPADALRIRGRHNAVNALAALALASAAGCTLAHMLYGLREYRGEPHRVEPVAIVDGVEYFDDSKGTNVGATVAAVTGLGAERRVVVILGGEGKGQDFSPLAAPVARFARAVVLIGRDAPLIRAALADTGVALFDAATLPQAVNLAAQRTHAGDAVLLSPACASFDMFRDYEHRAQVFCEAVRSLADDAGVSLEGMA